MTILKGLIIGATMLVPGVSGGTMAMILGVYDRLISAVSSFLKNPKSNLAFLGLFVLGAGIGAFFFATPISWLLEHYMMPTTYFFWGAVFGGVPLIEKKSGIKKISWDVILYMLLGAVSVVLISLIPNDTGLFGQSGGAQILTLLAAGIISAIALVLPGISVSHFLLILGVYEKLLNAIRCFDFLFLLPLGLGLMIGIFCFCKILENAMSKYPKQTYLIILGFILGSVAQIFPGIPGGIYLPVCIVTAAVGFCCVYKLIRL